MLIFRKIATGSRKIFGFYKLEEKKEIEVGVWFFVNRRLKI
jgi:hypothetical protein